MFPVVRTSQLQILLVHAGLVIILLSGEVFFFRRSPLTISHVLRECEDKGKTGTEYMLFIYAPNVTGLLICCGNTLPQ